MTNKIKISIAVIILCIIGYISYIQLKSDTLRPVTPAITDSNTQALGGSAQAGQVESSLPLN